MKFRVEIPREVLGLYDDDTHRRILSGLTAVGATDVGPGPHISLVAYYNNYDCHTVVAFGDAPSQAVTILAAMAQGHPIDALLEAAGV